MKMAVVTTLRTAMIPVSKASACMIVNKAADMMMAMIVFVLALSRKKIYPCTKYSCIAAFSRRAMIQMNG